MEARHRPGARPRDDRPRTAVAERFNRWSADYEDSVLQETFYVPVHTTVLHLAQQAVPDPLRVLDVGCGTGRLLRSAARLFPAAQLIGVDVAERMLRRASVLDTPNAHAAYVDADAARLPLRDDTIDVAACTACCHHFDDPAAVFGEIARVLHPRGILLLAHLLGVADWAGPATPGKPGRAWRAETAAFKALLSASGLTVTSTKVYTLSPVMPGTVVIRARLAATRSARTRHSATPGGSRAAEHES